MSTGSYFELDGPSPIKSGDLVRIHLQREVWNVRVTTIRRLRSGLHRYRYVLHSLVPTEESAIKFVRGLTIAP